MEERKLDAQESIELITRMIRNTRRRLEHNAGRPFLVWGYTTVAISLFNYLIRITGADPQWSLSWFLIPVLGVVLMRLFPAKRSTEPRTEIDRIVNALWIVCSLALIPIFVICLFHGTYRTNLLMMIALTMAIGTAATGLIVRSKVYAVSGLLGMALTTLFAFNDFALKYRWASGAVTEQRDLLAPYNEILIFAAIFVVMMVVPGHIINYQNRRETK